MVEIVELTGVAAMRAAFPLIKQLRPYLDESRYLQLLAEMVPRGFVSLLKTSAPQIPSNASGRLELAEWLSSPANPLTARVAVNRIWLHLFGQGLVRTADNFGSTGEVPSHPELLDALANQFIESGWSVKSMVRSLVLSRTYQLSTATNPAGQELGRDDLMALARSLNPTSAETFGTQLVEAVSAFRGGRVPEDDETIIVLQRVSDLSG